jgi:hypothetical protein
MQPVPGLGEHWKSGGKSSERNCKTFTQFKGLKLVDLLTCFSVLNEKPRMRLLRKALYEGTVEFDILLTMSHYVSQ